MSTPAKILLVDDDARNLRILDEILSDDYMLETAASGEEALEKLDSFAPDIILLDIMMPNMDGLEVCRRVRKDNGHRFVKILLVSGKARIEERLEGYASGADDYITKPFDHLELLAKIKVYARLKAVEEIDRLKTDFLSLITHETGTPLNAIIGFSSVLSEKDSMSEEDKSIARQIYEAGFNLHEKMSKILSMAAVKSNGVGERHPVSLSTLLDEVRSSFELQTENVVRVDFGDVPDVIVHISPEYTKNAVFYVIETAASLAARDGEIVVRYRLEHGGTICCMDIEVTNSVSCVVDMAAIFDAFSCADILHHDSGLGVDLALAKSIFIHQGGDVSAVQGAGSRIVFSLCLPVMSAESFSLQVATE